MIKFIFRSLLSNSHVISFVLYQLDALIHPFFDELRDPNTRLPSGRFLPPLFNFKPHGMYIISQYGQGHVKKWVTNYFLLFIWKIRAARVLAYFQMVNCYHSLISMQVQTLTDLNYSFWFVLLIMMNRVEECADGYCGEAGTRACEEAMPLSRALRTHLLSIV